MVNPINFKLIKTQISNGDKEDIRASKGIRGLETVETITDVVKDYNKSNPGKELRLKYDKKTGSFVILNSSTSDKNNLVSLLTSEDRNYAGWKPELITIEDYRDPTKQGLGIKLVPIE